MRPPFPAKGRGGSRPVHFRCAPGFRPPRDSRARRTPRSVFQDGSDGPARSSTSRAFGGRSRPPASGAAVRHCGQSRSVGPRRGGRAPSGRVGPAPAPSVGARPRRSARRACPLPEEGSTVPLAAEAGPAPTLVDACPGEVRRPRRAGTRRRSAGDPRAARPAPGATPESPSRAPCRVRRLPSERFRALFNSLFKVLFIFPSRYLSAIGLTPVFSFRWSLPPPLGCIPKQPDSWKAPRGPSGRAADGVLTLRDAPFQATWTRPERRPGKSASLNYNSPTLRAEGAAILSLSPFPLHSPLLGESWLVSFPPLINMLKFGGSSCLI